MDRCRVRQCVHVNATDALTPAQDPVAGLCIGHLSDDLDAIAVSASDARRDGHAAGA